MRKSIFLILTLLCTLAYGQDTLRIKCYNSSSLGGMTYEVPVLEKLSDTSIVRKFNHGFDLFFAGQTDEAISIWKEIVKTSKDIHSNVYGMAFFYIADAYFATKQSDSSEFWFKKILSSSLIDSTETGDFREPYGNYKYISCKRLSSIYGFYKPDYDKALAYIDSAENNYPYYGFPGSMTSVMEQKTTRIYWKATILAVSRKEEDAYYTLLNEYYITDYPEYFEENNKFLLEIISENKLKDEYLSELNKSLGKLTVETNGNWTTGTFKFRGKTYSKKVANDKKDVKYSDDRKLIIKGFEVQDKNKEYFANKIKKSSFYSALNGK